MRIVIFHSHFTTLGGAENLMVTQAHWLTRAGHDVRIVALHVDTQYAACHMKGLRVDAVGFPKGVSRAESLTSAMMPEVIERARRHLKDCDTVMAFNFPSAPVAAAATQDARRVWYACEPFRALYLREGNPVTVRRVEETQPRTSTLATAQIARRLRRRKLQQFLMPWTSRRDQSLKAFDRAGVQNLDGVASLSHYGAGCVADATGRRDARIICPMIQFADVAERRRGLERDAPQILVQTRFAIPKNLDTLIRGFGIVIRTHPRARLHIVGTGSGRAHLEELVRAQAPNAVQFHGFLLAQELDRLSALCDVFAFVPLDEPFGMVFPESAARGLLLVGPDHGGPREILEDGAIGELCDPFCAASVAEAILRTLALSDEAADARRSAAAASVRARFSPDVVGRSLTQFLRS